jgi:hypothetical protein
MTSLMITAITTTAMMITMMTSITITSMWPKDASDDEYDNSNDTLQAVTGAKTVTTTTKMTTMKKMTSMMTTATIMTTKMTTASLVVVRRVDWNKTAKHENETAFLF